MSVSTSPTKRNVLWIWQGRLWHAQAARLYPDNALRQRAALLEHVGILRHPAVMPGRFLALDALACALEGEVLP